MERRDFIKTSLAFAALVVSDPVASLSEETAASQKAKVFFTHGETRDALTRMVAKLGGIEKFVKKGDLVLLKPNFSFSNPPEAGATTSPTLVKSIALMCKDAGAKSILVLDNTIRQAKACLERTGIEEALKGMDKVTLSTPQRPADYKEVEVGKGKELKKVKVASAYYDADVYINLPIAKSHSASIVSLGLKNQMGLIYDRAAFHSRYDLYQAIADLATVMRPHLTIMDATRCLKDNGPGGPGKVVKPDLVLCSTDPVALDAYTTTLVEWWGKPTKPEKVKHIGYAYGHGLGEMDLAKIEAMEC